MANGPNNEGGVLSLTILVEGTELPSTIPISRLTITHEVNRITFAEVTLVEEIDPESSNFAATDNASIKPGGAIVIKASWDGTAYATLFDGLILKNSLRMRTGEAAELVLECRDKAVKLTNGKNSNGYVDKKDSDIISQLIGDAGLTASVTATAEVHKQMYKYQSTAWDFIVSRAEANGMMVTLDAGKVTVGKPNFSTAPGLKLTYGVDLMSADLQLDAQNQVTGVKVLGWDPATQATVEAESSAPELNEWGNVTASSLTSILGSSTETFYVGAKAVQGDLKAFADARLLRYRGSWLSGTAECLGTGLVLPGGIVELSGVSDKFTGKAFVYGVSHHIDAGNWTTRFTFGLNPGSFAEEEEITQKPATAMLPSVSGLQIGIVAKLNEDPDGEFRIQVRLALAGETDTVWARLASFYASNQIGAFFYPEVGDEVILGFVNDDPREPIILGSLYSSKLPTPLAPTAENHIKTLVTRSKMKLTFDDDKKIVTIETPGGNKMVMDDDAKKIEFTDSNKNKVTMSDAGLVLDSPKDIKINAKGAVTIDAVGKIGITSKQDVALAGLNVNAIANVGFTAKGNATAEISASGQTTVKGGIVMIN